MMLLPRGDFSRKAQRDIETLMRTGMLSAKKRTELAQQDLRWLAIYPQYRPVPSKSALRLESCFGPPVHQTDAIWLYDMGEPADTLTDCIETIKSSKDSK